MRDLCIAAAAVSLCSLKDPVECGGLKAQPFPARAQGSDQEY